LREKVTVSRDVLRRLDVFAPVTGTVQNMKVFTVGAVIRSGEPLIDVVPENDELIVQAQFSPSDIDSFQIGSQAEIRFSSFHNRSLPMIPGTVRSISRDRLIDEATKQPYYLVIVAVNQSALPSELTGKVMPGLPIEIIIPTTQRTVVEYLVQPLMSTLRKTMRER
jgi:HlyD family type I secretion membrane fusion protein